MLFRLSVRPSTRSRGLQLLLGAWLLVAVPAPASAATAEHQQLLEQAIASFDEAVSLQHDPARATQLYRQAAGGFQALADEGIRNADLEYNLGTAYYRAGDIGRSILHYRRALDIAPQDHALAANLNFVREHVSPRLEPAGQGILRERLLGWQFSQPLNLRFTLAFLASLLGWGLLGCWLIWRWPSLRPGGIVLALLGLAAGGSVYWELSDRASRPAAVVILADQTLRKGRGIGSDPAIRQPLGPGVELRILQERGGWVEVELVNGLSGWLPADSTERV